MFKFGIYTQIITVLPCFMNMFFLWTLVYFWPWQFFFFFCF